MEENPGAICSCSFVLTSSPCRACCFLCLLDYLHGSDFKLPWNHLHETHLFARFQELWEMLSTKKVRRQIKRLVAGISSVSFLFPFLKWDFLLWAHRQKDHCMVILAPISAYLLHRFYFLPFPAKKSKRQSRCPFLQLAIDHPLLWGKVSSLKAWL